MAKGRRYQFIIPAQFNIATRHIFSLTKEIISQPTRRDEFGSDARLTVGTAPKLTTNETLKKKGRKGKKEQSEHML